MAHDPFRKSPALPGAINFEITDLADARRALDELPAWVAEVGALPPNYWEQRRRRPRPQDRALAGATIDWMLKLPPALRPLALCERYPRVANAVAAAWPQGAERAALLASLLGDSRARRSGFPAEVRSEIAALRDWQSTTEGSGTARS